MRVINIKKLFLIAALFYLPFQSMAWGVLGHRIVGEIADSYLSTKARAEIRKILGNESIAIASNWPDFIKSDPSYKYLDSWHYVDFDGQFTYPEMQSFLKQDTITDAYTKLNFLIKELKMKNLPAEKKQMYLRLVIHIVGDIHQPMHTGHVSDRGGNDVKITWFNRPLNLHSLWDSELIEFQELSYTEYARAINFTTTAQRQAWQKEDISQWIFNSYQLANNIYANTPQDAKLSYRYNFDYIDRLNQQLLKGGVHLAGLLNQIFAS